MSFDADMEAIMKKKFNDLLETNNDPQKRADVLIQRYVNIVDKIMLGTGNYKEDHEQLIQIREEATQLGLKFTFDIKVGQI